MRKALNVLQPCASMIDHADESITEQMVYDCVGSPYPKDIKTIISLCMTDQWASALHSVNLIKNSKGLALADILTGIEAEYATYELKPDTRIALLKGLSEIEWRLSTGGNEKIQTSATVGVIKSSMEHQAV